MRLAILLAPFLFVGNEFALPQPYLAEAKEFVSATACKAMLVPFPALVFISVMAAADKACSHGISPLIDTMYVCGFLCVGYGLYRIPARAYRGTLVPFYWLAGITAFDVVTALLVVPKATQLLCKL